MAGYNTYLLNDKGDVDFVKGELYISVSTILKTEAPGDFLIKWILREFGTKQNAQQAYYEFMDYVSALGTALHKYIEYDLKGDILPDNEIEESMLPGIEQWHAWRNENEIHALLNEQVMFSKKMRIAGTMDLLCTINGKKYIADIKTGSVKDLAFTQMIAYKAMAAEMGFTEVLDAELAVLSVHRDGKPVKLHTMESHFGGRVTEKDLFAKFQALRYVWYLNNLKSRKFKPIIKHWDTYIDPLIEKFKGQFEEFVPSDSGTLIEPKMKTTTTKKKEAKNGSKSKKSK